MISFDVSGSKFPVGSSAINTLGLFTIALAIATRCCCPPDNSCGKEFTLSSSPTNSKVALTLRRISTLGVSITSNAKATFSKTVFLGNSLKFWNTTPILRRKYGTLLFFILDTS